MVCCHVNKTLNWLSSIELCLSLEISPRSRCYEKLLHYQLERKKNCPSRYTI
jgi:hypothetical protein